jgi:hypothetical protein
MQGGGDLNSVLRGKSPVEVLAPSFSAEANRRTRFPSATGEHHRQRPPEKARIEEGFGVPRWPNPNLRAIRPGTACITHLP